MNFQARAQQMRDSLQGQSKLIDATADAHAAYRKGSTVEFVKASAVALQATQPSTEGTQRVFDKISELRAVRTPLLEQFKSPENLNLENLSLCRAFFRQVLLRLTDTNDLNRADLCDLGIAGNNPNAETLYSSDTLRVEVSHGSDRTLTLRYPQKDRWCDWSTVTKEFKGGLLTTVNIQSRGQTSGTLCDELNSISGMLNQTGDRQVMKITLSKSQATNPLPSGEELIFPAVKTFPMRRIGPLTKRPEEYENEMNSYSYRNSQEGFSRYDSYGCGPSRPDAPEEQASHRMLLTQNKLEFGAALPTLAALGAVFIRGSSTVKELVGGDLASNSIRVREGFIKMENGALSVVPESIPSSYAHVSVGEEIGLVSVSPQTRPTDD